MIVVAALLVIALIFRKKRLAARLALLLASLLAVVALSFVLKELVARPRPLPELYELFSYPSTHAASAALLAIFLSFWRPGKARFFWFFAGVVAISRVYLGAHFASDVLGGLALGTFTATIIMHFYEKIEPVLLAAFPDRPS